MTITRTRSYAFPCVRVSTGCLFMMLLLMAAHAPAATVAEAWVRRYSAPRSGDDHPNAVAVDGSGNVVVTGSSQSVRGDTDFATISYSGTGTPLWTNRYDGPLRSADGASAVAVDSKGNAFVTGYSLGVDFDLVTIGYSSSGIPLWTNHYNGAGNSYDYGTAIAVDAKDNVFVVGTSGGDYLTMAYSSAGGPLWTNRYNGQGNGGTANAVAVDRSGNVVVTGWSGGGIGGDYATIVYSGTGIPLWTNRYDGENDEDQAVAIAVDSSGNVFVTGYSVRSTSIDDYATIAYSGAGVPLWTNRYNGPGNRQDQAHAVAVDDSGNVFVTGWSMGTGFNGAYATIAYSGAGVPLWTNRYNPPNYGAEAKAIAVDSSGNVVVAGFVESVGPFNYDFATIAYSGAGVPLWTNRYNGPATEDDRPLTKSALAIGLDGAVYVTGQATFDESNDYATVKYVRRAEIKIQPLLSGSPTADLTLTAAPNSSWAIERAPILTNSWIHLTTILVPTNGTAAFQDTERPPGEAFYRARQP